MDKEQEYLQIIAALIDAHGEDLNVNGNTVRELRCKSAGYERCRDTKLELQFLFDPCNKEHIFRLPV